MADPDRSANPRETKGRSREAYEPVLQWRHLPSRLIDYLTRIVKTPRLPRNSSQGTE